MNIYLSSSSRDFSRDLASKLHILGHTVYDFSDPVNRHSNLYLPQSFPGFNPQNQSYFDYISQSDLLKNSFKNRQAILHTDVTILFLPCGENEAVNWALGVGLGVPSLIVGNPEPGKLHLYHNWATSIVETKEEIFGWLNMIEHANCRDCVFDDSEDNELNCITLEAIPEEIINVYPDDELPHRCGFFKPKDYCRICGCMEHSACQGGCSWVAPGLCSRCAGS